MENIKINKDLEKYLTQVDKYLKYIPVSEKTDILSELKNSFYERLKSGQTSDEIISSMPSAKDLATMYFEDTFTRDNTFSIKKFFAIILFYSYSSLIYLAVIPTFFSLAAGFIFSGIISFVAGLMGLIKGIVNISLLNKVNFIFLNYELKGLSALLVGIILAIVFTILGIISWRATIKCINFTKSKKYELKNRG